MKKGRMQNNLEQMSWSLGRLGHPAGEEAKALPEELLKCKF